MPRALRIALVPLVAGPLACASFERCREDDAKQQTRSEDRTVIAERIAAWLDCDECVEGQLGAVVELGETVVPSLVATLRDGVSPAYRARLERQLRTHHAARVARGHVVPGAGPALDEGAYVAQQVAGWEALHRSRAATALGRIGTPAAHEALRDALATAQRPSVEMALRAALERAP